MGFSPVSILIEGIKIGDEAWMGFNHNINAAIGVKLWGEYETTFRNPHSETVRTPLSGFTIYNLRFTIYDRVYALHIAL